MDAVEAIMTRRSVPKVAERRPSRVELERMLDAGVRAPTHHLTQPWRFVVMTGDALQHLGDAMADGAARLGKDPESIRDKPLRAPVVVCVICHPKTHLPKVVEVEEYVATGAVIQNILLSAHAFGLGAMIRSGPAVDWPEVRSHVGAAEGDVVVGFVYVGYPRDDAADRPMTRRTPASEVTEWRGWD